MLEAIQAVLQTSLPLIRIRMADVIDIAIISFFIYKLMWMLRKTSSGHAIANQLSDKYHLAHGIGVGIGMAALARFNVSGYPEELITAVQTEAMSTVFMSYFL